MTNKEKAKELSEGKYYYELYQTITFQTAMQMAEWKDEQTRQHEAKLLQVFTKYIDIWCTDDKFFNEAVREFKENMLTYGTD